MKIFIAYKFADENHEELNKILTRIKEALKKSNHDLFTTFFDKQEFDKNKATMRQIMDRSISYIDKSDIFLCLVKSTEKSEGQIFEVGYAVAKKKKIILAIQKGMKTRWIEHYADKIIEFDNLEDLYRKLENINLV